MAKLLFCVKCNSLMRKIKPLAEDMLVVQKVLVKQPQLFQNKGKMMIFNQILYKFPFVILFLK